MLTVLSQWITPAILILGSLYMDRGLWNAYSGLIFCPDAMVPER